jgi:3-oxoacyl-[acyl-carrier protein] reductase
MSEFTDKVVLVTGGTRGIGRACAEMFAREGARVAISGRDADTAESVAQEIAEASDGTVRGYGADVGDSAAVDAMVNAVRDEFGPVDVLINNAGVSRDGLLMRMKDDDWSTVLATNLSGVFYCCRAVARDMLKRRSGRIISISSVVGLRGQAGQTNYAAAKAGLIGMTKALAKELGARGITVNVVAPGLIDTDMTADLSDQAREALMIRIPFARTGVPEEVAGPVRFVASEAASYMTGAVLQIDGGLGI